jgi:hypothetical protein
MKAVEQALHALWGGAALIPVLLWPGILGGAASALLFALPRELVDQWPIKRPLDTVIDLAFFATGGAIAGAAVPLVASWLG